MSLQINNKSKKNDTIISSPVIELYNRKYLYDTMPVNKNSFYIKQIAQLNNHTLISNEDLLNQKKELAYKKFLGLTVMIAPACLLTLITKAAASSVVGLFIGSYFYNLVLNSDFMSYKSNISANQSLKNFNEYNNIVRHFNYMPENVLLSDSKSAAEIYHTNRRSQYI